LDTTILRKSISALHNRAGHNLVGKQAKNASNPIIAGIYYSFMINSAGQQRQRRQFAIKPD